MRQVAKRDANEKRLIEYLRRIGLCVQQISQEGVPDLLVAVPGTPFCLLLEVKDKRGKLTPTQLAWLDKWGGEVEIIRTIGDIKEIMRRFVPIYIYQCDACHEQLEVKQKFSDQPLHTCPKCGGTLRRLPQIAGVIYEGPGFTKRTKRPTNSA